MVYCEYDKVSDSYECRGGGELLPALPPWVDESVDLVVRCDEERGGLPNDLGKLRRAYKLVQCFERPPTPVYRLRVEASGRGVVVEAGGDDWLWPLAVALVVLLAALLVLAVLAAARRRRSRAGRRDMCAEAAERRANQELIQLSNISRIECSV